MKVILRVGCLESEVMDIEERPDRSCSVNIMLQSTEHTWHDHVASSAGGMRVFRFEDTGYLQEDGTRIYGLVSIKEM